MDRLAQGMAHASVFRTPFPDEPSHPRSVTLLIARRSGRPLAGTPLAPPSGAMSAQSAASAATMMLLYKRGAPAVLLPEFLREVYVGQRTGLLHVTRGELAGVSFRSVNGEIVSGSSTNEKGRLGEMLVRQGLLKRADLERALVIVTKPTS